MTNYIIHKGSKNTFFQQGASMFSCLGASKDFFLADGDSLEEVAKGSCDLIIFDAVSRNGEEGDCVVVRKLRELRKYTPIFLVTNRGTLPQYREKMFDAGVDGGAELPFSQDELILRVNKLIQKKDELLFSGTKIDAKNVSLDLRHHVVQKNGKIIRLTKSEYSILLHLFLHKNMPVSSSSLAKCLGNHIKERSSAINIHILNLRRKLGSIDIIKTLPHYGFSISDSFVTTQ